MPVEGLTRVSRFPINCLSKPDNHFAGFRIGLVANWLGADAWKRLERAGTVPLQRMGKLCIPQAGSLGSRNQSNDGLAHTL